MRYLMRKKSIIVLVMFCIPINISNMSILQQLISYNFINEIDFADVFNLRDPLARFFWFRVTENDSVDVNNTESGRTFCAVTEN